MECNIRPSDFNPLPPHGGRHRPVMWCISICRISIHSLRMEGDVALVGLIGIGCHFNPLPPHGGRPDCVGYAAGDVGFQSTPSAWRETVCQERGLISWKNFNPLPPHGGRRSAGQVTADGLRFQSTPSAWRETVLSLVFLSIKLFQSTPSAWRETAKLHRKAFFISPILVQSCKKGCKRLHSAPEKMVFFEKREKNLVRNLQHLSVRL